MNTAILIPARFSSSRFAGKPLAKILGKPMIQWVYEGINNSRLSNFKAVLTDDKRIADCVEGFGGRAFMIKGNFKSGTDRIAAFCKDKPFDYIVNLQGDEPLIRPETMDKLIDKTIKNKDCMATLIKKCERKEADNHNVVKAVTDKNGYALYFSRSRIPFDRNAYNNYFKHIGIYIYSKDTLIRLYNEEPTPLEKAEGLEQLRALENGVKIKTYQTEETFVGVDIKEDIKKVENILRNRL